MSLQQPKPRKAKRVSKACDFCHSRSIRCRPSAEEGTARCQNCYDYQHPCRYTRPTLKRGTRARQDPAAAGAAGPSSAVSDQGASQSPLGPWQAPQLASPAVIADLVDVFFDIVYPLFPLFHRRSFLQRIQRTEYLSDRSFFACVMAVCSLSAGRVRDGALITPHANLDEMRKTSPDSFLDAAHSALPKDVEAATEFDYLRCIGLLAVASLQKGHIRNMHFYLGQYITICKVNSLHVEAKWPRGIPPIEREERRRLFWSIYTLEVFSAAVFETQVSFRESQCLVSYPLEIDDDSIAALDPHASIPPHLLNPNPPHWLHGWNFTTEIHRAMEHTIDQIRLRRNPANASSGPLVGPNSFDKFPAIMAKFENLSPTLTHVYPISGDHDKDCYSFQAANIMANIHMLRISYLSAGNATIEENCAVITEFLEHFARIPIDYLRAISTPLLFHIAGLGTIIGPHLERPLRMSQYENLRATLTALVDFLGGLEAGMSFAKGASERLRAHMQRLDEHMRNWSAAAASARPRLDALATGVGRGMPAAAAGGRPPLAYANRMTRPPDHHGMQSDSPMVPVPQDLLDDFFMSFDFSDPSVMPPG